MKIIKDLEGPIIYGLTVIAALVSLLVYGTTRVRSGDGLLSSLRPYFGIPFGLTISIMLIAILAINRHWKGIVVAIAAYGLMLLLSFSPTRMAPLPIESYFALSSTLALLLTAGCLYYDLLD